MRKIIHYTVGVPNLGERAFQAVHGDVQITQEIAMSPVIAIIRLFGRHLQEFADQHEIEIKQKGSMEEQGIPTSALRIAGEFPRSDGWQATGDESQIGMASD